MRSLCVPLGTALGASQKAGEGNGLDRELLFEERTSKAVLTPLQEKLYELELKFNKSTIIVTLVGS